MYEKYFSGLERIEPVRERDDMRRMLRELMRAGTTNTRQKHRLMMLKARFATMELYWTRNLIMMERGTHPRQKFRLELQDRQRRDIEERRKMREEQTRRLKQRRQENEAIDKVYEKYMEARAKCGQSTSVSADSVRDTLKKQVRNIKSRYRVDNVKFKVTVVDGKAKLKAVPIK